MEQSLTLLKTHGLKATPQRIAIYNYLRHTTAHPTVETIYASLHPANPTMSLATVYKTVESLRDAGLVQQLNVGEDCFRYDAFTAPHPHIKCQCCKQVFDLDVDVVKDLAKQAGSHSAFLITGAQVYLYGVCPDCQKASQES